MKIIKLPIKTKSKNYSIIIGSNLIFKIDKLFKKEKINFEKCLIIADKKVPKKIISQLKKNLKCKKVLLNYFSSTEKNKSLKSINKILSLLFKNNFNRNDCLISLGGGITGDVTSFAASIFKRGLKFINIPTTLLAQVDSSIGGKTGVNNNYGKNLIGTFYQPDLVISDINFLHSLPKRELVCGYGEILKHSLISSNNNFKFLEKNSNKIINLNKTLIQKAIVSSCKIKRNIVEKDEKEKDIRKMLNFGHTFAHAYEATFKFSKKLNHGEAVILGIISASKFSYINNLLSKNEYDKIINHINNLNFRINIKYFFKKKYIKSILKYMKSDKKNKSDKINLILLKKIGKPVINLNFNYKKIELFLKNNLFN